MLLSLAYRYDGNGNRTAKVGTQAGLGGITVGNNAMQCIALDISYHYDVRGQLLEERRNGASVSYTYDKAGNRVRKTDAKGATLYQFNRKNQLIAEESSNGKNQFTYDGQGGIVEEKNSKGTRLFSYNSRHQQTKVETESGHVQENRYDVENLRFELLENGKRTGFVYHDGELLHEEGGNEQQNSYHLGAGIDALQRGQDLSYYHRDEQLSTAFITDWQGAVENCYQYDAFGNMLDRKEQLSNRILYTGQQYDELTEQYYLRARYYSPILGRFMQEDVYQGDGLNLYAYCGNNPVVYYDPSGYAGASQQSGYGCPPNGNIGGDGNGEDGVETDPFLPNSYYEDGRLPKFVSPGTESLPKYDEYGNLTQIKYYDDYGREIGWVDLTDHGYSLEHSAPHWHEVQWNAQYPIGGYKIDHRFDTNPPFNWQQDFERYGGSN